MSFTIVITTFNRSNVLRHLLGRLEEQIDKGFEVIVAMDGCTDDTCEMLKHINTSFPLRWVDTGCKGYGLALARNAGILAAKQGVVAIIDDDSLPVPSFVAAHRAAVTPRCISGGPRMPHDPSRDTRLAKKLLELRRLPPLQPMQIGYIHKAYPKAWLVENNISMLRADWIEIGLFTERIKMYGVIGQEFFARAEYLSWTYQFVEDAGVFHREEIEGDNGLHRSRKIRETRIASFLRPGLMNPKQYAAQQAWALALDKGETPPVFSPWLPGSILCFCKRFLFALRRHLFRRFIT